MSTRLREVAEIDGYIYKGAELETFIRQNAARYKMPFATHQERAQVIASYPAHVHKFWVFRDPRRAKIGQSVYKRILHEKGIGGKKSRGNTAAGRVLEWEPPTRARVADAVPLVTRLQQLQREQTQVPVPTPLRLDIRPRDWNVAQNVTMEQVLNGPQPQAPGPVATGGRDFHEYFIAQPPPWRVQTRTATQVPATGDLDDFDGPEEEENEDND